MPSTCSSEATATEKKCTMERVLSDSPNRGDFSTRTPTLTAVGLEASISYHPPRSSSRGTFDSYCNAALPGSCLQRLSRANSGNQRRKCEENPSRSCPMATALGRCMVDDDETTEAKKRDHDNRSPWILHFCRDVVKSSSFDEQFRGQLRSSRTSHKLGELLHSTDVQTYARLSQFNPFNLIKLIQQTIQHVNVHKKPCDQLAHYLSTIDDLRLPLHKSPELTNPSDSLVRVLTMLQETLVVAYILVRTCEIRTPVYSGSFNNIPAKLNAVERELQRIIPVLRRAFLHQNLSHNPLPVVRSCTIRGASAEDLTNDSAPAGSCSPKSLEAVSTKENGKSSSAKARIVFDGDRQLSSRSTSGQSLWSGKSSWQRNLFSPWRLDEHTLKLLRRPMQTYTCQACNKVGEGCVYCCEGCDYNVHPECIELNEAIQRLKEISLTKLSGSDSWA